MAAEIRGKLRDEVARRAHYRCEYCLLHENDAAFSHQVDHIISRKHGGSSRSENLAYACVLGNRHKGTDVAAIDPDAGDAVRLFHPRRDRWTDHVHLAGEYIESRTVAGRATVRLLRLNSAERLTERRLFQTLGTYPMQ